jgi:hypothetical protein
MLHELGVNDPIQSRCGASSTSRQLPDGKSHHGHACSGAGCWLRSTAQKHCPPYVTFQAVTARCAGRNSQNRGQRTCFAAIGWDGARLSHHLTPARARASPLAPNRHVPCSTQWTHATGLWVARWCPLSEGSSGFGRSGPRYARALCSSQLLRHVLNEKQRASRAVACKSEATVRGCRRAVGAGRPPVSM